MLILISKNRLDVKFATRLAKELKTELVHPQETEQQIKALRASPRAEVIFDADQPELFSQLEASLLSPELMVPRFHFVSSESLNQCRYVFQSPFFMSQIRRSESMVAFSVLLANLSVAQPGEETLGMNQVLSPIDKSEQSFPISSNLEKVSVLGNLKQFLGDAKLGERNLATVVMAADELLMNAIFDAPVDEMGTRISISASRTSPVRLQGRRRIELKAGFNATHVAVQVRDFFGSLERGHLFDKLAEVYGLNDYKINLRSAGAGLGLASVHRSGGSLIFDCLAGQVTSVTALFSRVESAQKLRDCFHFIRCEFR